MYYFFFSCYIRICNYNKNYLFVDGEMGVGIGMDLGNGGGDGECIPHPELTLLSFLLA